MTIYTYIINSTIDGSHFYGQTTNIMRRLNQHNRGLDDATRAKRPWVLKAYKEFSTRGGAMSYERRLKALTTQTEIDRFIRDHEFHII